ncbi:MAG: hypothetical protein LiPW16_239 [Microgenomates group bacterium LiPW_16]|nr:MAG: hypothetical protein LiPW16_239 [Microgenomates group bacterium LiPW_16]
MKESCCQTEQDKKHGFLPGLVSGLLPHSVCIGFIILTIIGTTTMAGVLKKLLLVPFFFETLVALSLIFATISAITYLGRNELLSFAGAKRKWKYLLVLYGTTILVNLFLFTVVFPYVANKAGGASILSSQTSTLTLRVSIPCSGHAPLISQELKNLSGIESVAFVSPNLFKVNYQPLLVSPKQILSLEVFKAFKATVQK